MIARLLHRLLFTLALVAGADLVLFATLDSGLLGDQAIKQVGAKASSTDIGYARVRLGVFEQFEPAAIRLQMLHAERSQRMSLQCDDGILSLVAADGTVLRQVPLQGTVGDISMHMVTWSGEGWQIQAFSTTDAKALPASGLATALNGLSTRLPAGEAATMSWAKATPISKRFLTSFWSLLRFDFGYDRDGRLVSEQLSQRGGRSLMISLPAFALTMVLAIGLACTASGKRRRWDKRLQIIAALVMSVSSLAWILFLRQWFTFDLDWFPLRPWSDPILPLLILPILIWVYLSVWPDYLLYRSIVQQRASEGWLRAARARGISTPRLLWRHLLPNLAAPIASLLAVTLPFLVLGSLLLEHIFDIPGLGGSLLEAVEQHDVNILRALTFLFAIGYLMAQWLGEVIASSCDPRLRGAS
ncbi:MAG: ABC transporter permease [Planctomycetes bacterium]|nr:ABC transporter permease [Planctomycetota bacterium]MCP4770975.1 ABC transporter permease [Planctomycetota bacterium]MCP4861694.1 ABC transporter permease [Planctomycetota bacterium]